LLAFSICGIHCSSFFPYTTLFRSFSRASLSITLTACSVQSLSATAAGLPMTGLPFCCGVTVNHTSQWVVPGSVSEQVIRLDFQGATKHERLRGTNKLCLNLLHAACLSMLFTASLA